MSWTNAFALWLLATSTQPPQAPAPSVPEEQRFAEQLVVSATASAKDSFGLPYSVATITGMEIQERQAARTLPEALSEVTGVAVQKTSHGQGSPYLRGFTGFRTLLLIDGIRLNNSVLREGPNQYWGTVDAWSLENIEVVRGPSSVAYGSDAIGGTVNALTVIPHDAGRTPRVRLYARGASAEHSLGGRVEAALAPRENLSLILGGSLRDFGELRAGGAVGRQSKTGYDDAACDAKVIYQSSPGRRWVFAHQRFAQDDAWRTHRTPFGVRWQGTTSGSDLRHVLDQGRDLSYVQFHESTPGGLLDSLAASFSLQRQEEDLDRVRSDGRRELSGFAVATLGAWLQLERATSRARWSGGFELYGDRVDSYSRRLRADGSLERVGVQGPVADDATYDLWGIWAQAATPVASRLEVLVGARLSGVRVDANRVQDPLTGQRTTSRGNWSRLLGNARGSLRLDTADRWRIFGGISQGFRAPNLSDLTRFDIARSREIETPSPELRPESFLSYEIGLKSREHRWSGELTLFYTEIDALVIRVPTGRLFDSNAEVTKRNAGSGFVRGVEVSGEIEIGARWRLWGGLSWLDGRVDAFATAAPVASRAPLDKLAPPGGCAGLRFTARDERLWLEVLAQAADRQDKLSPRDGEDTDRIPPQGTPGYTVLSLRSGWALGDALRLTLALENVADRPYRVHGSGINAAGRSVVLAVAYRQ